MKKLFISALAAGILAAVTGCDVHFNHGWSDADLKASTNVIQTDVIPAGLKSLSVDNRFGSVRIVGTNTGPTSWTWKLRVRATNDLSAQRILSEAHCEAKLDGDQMKLVVTLPDPNEPYNYQSDLEIITPQAASVQTQNRFGLTQIADLAGNVEAAAENGSLEIRNIVGSVRAKNSFATLSVNHTGTAILHGQNGSVTATDIQGALEADTSFASLTAKGVAGAATLQARNGTLQADDVHGVLKAKTSFAPLAAHNIDGAADLRNQNGSIDAAQIQGDADIETSFSRLSVTGVKGNVILQNQNGSITANDLTGLVKATTSYAAMNITGAGSSFVCDNQNGSIQLHATSLTLASITASTSFSTLTVRLPAALKPAIQARTSFADVESDFPVLMKPADEDPFANLPAEKARIKLLNQNGKISVVHD